MQRQSPIPAILRDPRYVTSAHLPRQWVTDSVAEVAFAGRSNVGKSSAINAITQRRGLARTSKTPGRTQHIVFFGLRPGRYLVDLPGYGYARVPNALKEHWRYTVETYLTSRSALKGLILLMDARRPLTRLDEQMLAWSEAATLPTFVLLTKADKLGRGALADSTRRVRHALRTTANDTAVVPFSAVDRTGVEAAQTQVARWLDAP